jgi:hypothetical protein
MKIIEFLTEAKARIEHPEDRILDDGSAGAISALESILDAASSSKNISIKFDGSVAIIAGIVNGQFVMSDKGGMAKQQFPKSSKEIYNMLFNRKPDQLGRSNYSAQVSGLFRAVQKIIPKNFPGLIQFDVMWFSIPPLVNDNYQFKPNKVVYNVPQNSKLGKQIALSHYGIVVHSYFDAPDDDEPRAINDFQTLGLIPSKEIVVLNPKVTFEVTANKKLINDIRTGITYVNKYSTQIDTFINKSKLASLKITDLPAIMKKFLAQRAGAGMYVSYGCSNDFIGWLERAELTPEKKQRMLDYINTNSKSYNKVWEIIIFIVDKKNELLKIFGNQNQDIQANINGEIGHEGFVVDAPSGKIKLVNRPLFMKR